MDDHQSKSFTEFVREKHERERIFRDLIIGCIDCGESFIWLAGEQEFYRDKGLLNPPKRCKECKQAKNKRIRTVLTSRETGIRQKIEVEVFCDECSVRTTVPFYPSENRPVLCRSCYIEKNPRSPDNNTASGQ